MSLSDFLTRVVLPGLAATWLIGIPMACTPGTGLDDEQVGGDGPGGNLAIRGTLNLDRAPAGQAAPANGREVGFAATGGFVVTAVSEQTQRVYRGVADENGAFEIDIPGSESGNTFVLTIVGSDGKPLGPVLLAVADGTGLTGLKPQGDVDLGDIGIPANLGLGPIMAAAEIPEASLDDDSKTRLGENDVPVGVNSFGKGAGTLLAGEAGDGADGDEDGLVDLFDADDDGDGIIDDLEDGAGAWGFPTGDVRANFFMNLKIQVEDSRPFYHGTPEELAEALSRLTVITFEVQTEPSAARTITGAHLLDSPAPDYLPLTTEPWTGQLWSLTGYALEASGDRFGTFVTPNAVMEVGDTFTVQVDFDDGGTERYSRMLNYIFTSIPRLVRWGPPGALADYDPGDPPLRGSPRDPLLFDGTRDLVLEFIPPLDESGAPLEGFDYSFQFFYFGDDGLQINGNDIDYEATFPAPVPGMDRTCYWVRATDPALATLSAENTYTVQLPGEAFVDQVVLNDGSTVDVARYKIDITAECPSGNAAITVIFEKQ